MLFVAASGFVLVLTLVSSLQSDSGGIVDLQSGCAVNNVSLTYINVFSNTHLGLLGCWTSCMKPFYFSSLSCWMVQTSSFIRRSFSVSMRGEEIVTECSLFCKLFLRIFLKKVQIWTSSKDLTSQTRPASQILMSFTKQHLQWSFLQTARPGTCFMTERNCTERTVMSRCE